MKTYSHFVSEENIIIHEINGDSTVNFSINVSSAYYNIVKEHVFAGEYQAAINFIDISLAVTNYSEGNIRIENGELFYKDKLQSSKLIETIINLMENKYKPTPLLKFLDNLIENPSYRAQKELYDFLQKGKLPITTDGFFLAYKIVGPDYLDKHTNTMDNSLGKIVTMPRNEVDDDSRNACAAGLHACSQGYVPYYGDVDRGDHLMVVKINPKDVVSIPFDHNLEKLRCCEYEVISEIPFDQVGITLESTAIHDTESFSSDGGETEFPIEKFDEPEVSLEDVGNIFAGDMSYDDEDSYDEDSYDEDSYDGR